MPFRVGVAAIMSGNFIMSSVSSWERIFKANLVLSRCLSCVFQWYILTAPSDAAAAAAVDWDFKTHFHKLVEPAFLTIN